MSAKGCLVLLLAALGALWGHGVDAAEAPRLVRLEDVLNRKQLEHIAHRRGDIVVPPGSAYRFVFEKGPRYAKVEVYYLIGERQEGGRTVRYLASFPSAVIYDVYLKTPSELTRHLSGERLREVLKKLRAARQAGREDPAVRIRRALFDIGAGSPGAFLKSRDEYYNDLQGQPNFDSWPPAFRLPSGQFSVDIVQTDVTGADEAPQEVRRIEGRQFFGYMFPVLDDLLTGKQKEKLADDLGRSNVRDGAAHIEVEDVKDYGDVRITYLVRKDRALAHPTAMSSRVVLTAEQIREDPLVLRKYLPPEGVAHLTERIKTGEQRRRKVKAVEILRMHFDIVTRGEPQAQAVHDEFRKDIRSYCRRDVLLRPETWPDRFRRPDGIFDVELALTRIVWIVVKPR